MSKNVSGRVPFVDQATIDATRRLAEEHDQDHRYRTGASRPSILTRPDGPLTRCSVEMLLNVVKRLTHQIHEARTGGHRHDIVRDLREQREIVENEIKRRCDG